MSLLPLAILVMANMLQYVTCFKIQGEGSQIKNQLENLGTKSGNQINNQHCQIINTHFQCTSGPGRRVYNSGAVWDPTWNCMVCCEFPGKTIPHCDRSMGEIKPIGGNIEEDPHERNPKGMAQIMSGSGNVKGDPNELPATTIQPIMTRNFRGMAQIMSGSGKIKGDPNELPATTIQPIMTRNFRGMGQIMSRSLNVEEDPNELPATTISPDIQQPNVGINNQQMQSRNHCRMVNTNFQCTSGPGRKIYNSGIVWDPNQEKDAGVDETFNCTPCCQFPGKTIPQCSQSIEKIGSRNEDYEEDLIEYSSTTITPINTRNIEEDCQNGNGSDYDGNVNTTRYGHVCQHWSSQSPHSHKFGSIGNHNSCRNPDGYKGVWCYTTDSNNRWEYCNVSICG